MKGIVLASAIMVVAFILSVLLFRLGRIERRAYALLWIFVVCALLLTWLSLVTSDDLTFLPNELLATPWWVDLLSSLVYFTAGFFGGILQLYNLADRGFSLRIMIDVLERGDQHNNSTASLFDGYSDGKGLAWMYQKRLDDLKRNGLVIVEGDTLVLTEAGRRTAIIFGRIRWLFGFTLPRGAS